MTTLDLTTSGKTTSRSERPRAMDARPVRAVLLLRLSGADLSAHLAASAVSHLRRQHRVGDDRRHRVHARPRTRQPRRRLAVEAARHSAVAAARRDRDSRPALFGAGLARDLRPGRRADRRLAAAGDGGRQSRAGDRADAADGRDAAGAGRAIWCAAPATSAAPSASSITSTRSAPAPPVSSARCCCFRSSACKARSTWRSAINGAVAVGALVAHWRDRRGADRGACRAPSALRRAHEPIARTSSRCWRSPPPAASSRCPMRSSSSAPCPTRRDRARPRSPRR